MSVDGLITDDPLEGNYAVKRELFPRTIAQLVRANAYDDALTKIEVACGRWGGALHPMVPIEDDEREVRAEWQEYLRESLLDYICTYDLIDIPQNAHETIGQYGALAGQGPGRSELLLSVLARRPSHIKLRPVQSSHLIDRDDPWCLAYNGTWGRYPSVIDEDQLRYARLMPGTDYSSVIDVIGYDGQLGARHLLASLVTPEATTAADLSTVFLARYGAPYGNQFGQPPLLPLDREVAYDVGPNVIVVYDGNNARDLCLLWALRAAHGIPYGLPLAVPLTSQTADDIHLLIEGGAMRQWGLRSMQCALVSTSIDMGQLDEIAASIPQAISLDWRQIIQRPHPAMLTSTENVLFSRGRARVPSYSPSDAPTLGQAILDEHGAQLSLAVTVLGKRLPPSFTMRKDESFGPRYDGGCVVDSGRSRDFVAIQYPTGWDVLDALTRDRGLTCRPSSAGRLGEQFVKQLGSLDELDWLQAPTVAKILTRLSARQGQSYIKQRLNGFFKSAEGETLENFQDRLQWLEESLQKFVGSPDDEDLPYLQFSKISSELGGSQSAKAWLELAEASKLLVRGVLIQCDRCTYKSWRPLSEISPPVICHGCGLPVKEPFPHDAMTFRYRASPLLASFMSLDVLPHVLSIKYFYTLFRPHFKDDGVLYGSYPGVEFVDDSTGNIIGEADVVIVLADGRFILGECKSRAAGLRESDYEKLWGLSDRLGAAMTFVATLDPGRRCSDLWKRQRVNHVALTGGHLYDSFPIARLGGPSPFEWRDDYKVHEDGDLDEAALLTLFRGHLVDANEWRSKRDLPRWRLH